MTEMPDYYGHDHHTPLDDLSITKWDVLSGALILAFVWYLGARWGARR